MSKECFGCEAREDALRVLKAENNFLRLGMTQLMRINKETSARMFRAALSVEAEPVQAVIESRGKK